MRRLVIAALILTSAHTYAYAQSAPATPATVIMPSKYVYRLVQMLADPVIAKMLPLYQSDFAPLLQSIIACGNAQTPDARGVTVSHGECPEVQAADSAQQAAIQAAVAAAVARQKADDAAHAAPVDTITGH